MIISLDNIAKVFDKNPTSILVNTLCKLEVEGNLINMIRGIYTNGANLQLTSQVMVEDLMLFFKIGNKALNKIIRKEEEIKWVQMERKKENCLHQQIT